MENNLPVSTELKNEDGVIEKLQRLGFKINGFNQWELDINWFPKQYKKILIDFNAGYGFIRENNKMSDKRESDDVIYFWNQDIEPLSIPKVEAVCFAFKALTKEENKG